MDRVERVTIKHVAEAAGVSHPTVSRALRNHPRISEETKAKVRKVAKEMGYRPDPGMAVLIAHRTKQRPKGEYAKVALLNAWPMGEEGLPTYFREELRGLRKKAGELGYEVELFPLEKDKGAQRRLGRVLAARGIRGVVVGPLPADWPALDFNWKEFSWVAMGHSVMSPKLHYVASNHGATMEMGYGNLKQLGYERIGYCDSVSSERRNRHLHLAAYLKCLYLDGIAYDESPPLLYEPHTDWGPAEWLRKHRFDAVLVGQVEVTHLKLREAGLKVPEDVGLVSLDMFFQRPDYAGVLTDVREVGEAAMDLLHVMMVNGERGVPLRPHVVLLEGKWQAGGTAVMRIEGGG